MSCVPRSPPPPPPIYSWQSGRVPADAPGRDFQQPCSKRPPQRAPLPQWGGRWEESRERQGQRSAPESQLSTSRAPWGASTSGSLANWHHGLSFPPSPAPVPMDSPQWAYFGGALRESAAQLWDGEHMKQAGSATGSGQRAHLLLRRLHRLEHQPTPAAALGPASSWVPPTLKVPFLPQFPSRGVLAGAVCWPSGAVTGRVPVGQRGKAKRTVRNRTQNSTWSQVGCKGQTNK